MVDLIEISAQTFGVLGMITTVLSFQERNNKRFFIMQALSAFLFFMNYIMIGAVSAAFFSVTSLVRSSFIGKNKNKLWFLLTIEGLYTACFAYSLTFIWNEPFQIFLSTLLFFVSVLITFLMWRGNGKHIRYGQLFVYSPMWLVHNVFNFSLGGILCEIASMISIVVSFVRYGKDGFEK